MKIFSFFEKKTNFFIFISLLVHLIAVVFSIGAYNPGEHCILEFINTKFYFETEPCFQQDRIRSWFQPFVYFLISKILIFINIDNSFHWAFFYRLISSMLGFFSILLIVKNNTTIFSNKIVINIFVFTLLFFWFYPFLHTRTSAENFSISFLLISISILLYLLHNKSKRIILLLFFSGIFFGLAFISRYQIGVIVFSFFIWSYLYKKFSLKNLFVIFLGIFLILIIEIFINAWGYNNTTFSWGILNDLHFFGTTIGNNDTGIKGKIYKYIQYFPYLTYLNLQLFRSEALFQEEPWWKYIIFTSSKFFPPLSILVIFSFSYMWIFLRKNLITWITFPYIIIHCIIPHKEFRYIFPVLALFPFAISYALQDIILKKNHLYNLIRNKNIIYIFWFFIFINLLGLFVIIITPVDINLKFYNYFDKLKNINNLYYYNNKELIGTEVRDPFYKDESQLFFYHRLKTINIYNLEEKKYEDKIIHKKKMILNNKNQFIYSNKNLFIHILNPKINLKEFIINNKKNEIWIVVNQIKNIIEMNSLEKYCQLKFSNIPTWLLKFNINNWINRVKIYSIYHCIN